MRLRAVAVLLSLLFLSTAASAQMSEGEKKAAARAAYTEGVQLQDQGKPAEALARFEAAQGLFDAPTHLLRIAECQALTGKLVEASETYELLIRKTLPPGSPEPFVQAQEHARQELPALRQRIPTLRVTTRPDPKSLQGLVIVSNGRALPDGIIGIARPVNPGPYEVTATANGWGTKEATRIEVREKETKSLELVLVQGGTGGVVVVPPGPPGSTPTTIPPPPPPVIEEKPKEKPKDTASSTGLLLGGRGGLFVPGGSIIKGRRFDTVGTAGPGFGIDVLGRFARFLVVGGTLEFVSFGGPESSTYPRGARADVTAWSYYLGVTAGILPNIDKFSFVADVGLGLRGLSHKADVQVAGVTNKLDESFSGLEIGLNAGVSIPIGPLRAIPKAGIAYGQFTSQSCDAQTAAGNVAGCSTNAFGAVSSSNIDSAGHTIFTVTLGLYYHLDLSKKAASSNTSRGPSLLTGF